VRAKPTWFAVLALCLALAAPAWAGAAGHECCRLPHAPGQAGLQAPCCCPSQGSCCLAAPSAVPPAGVLPTAASPSPALHGGAAAPRPAAASVQSGEPAAGLHATLPDPGPLFLRHSSLLI
jgi:hypothetical protein